MIEDKNKHDEFAEQVISQIRQMEVALQGKFDIEIRIPGQPPFTIESIKKFYGKPLMLIVGFVGDSRVEFLLHHAQVNFLLLPKEPAPGIPPHRIKFGFEGDASSN